MRGTVRLGNKEVGMLANAASPFIYRQLFKIDFLKEVQAAEVDPNAITRMGYIMAMQAEKSTTECMSKLTMDGFYEWLEQFDGLDIFMAADDIFSLYKGQEVTLSDPKPEAV